MELSINQDRENNFDLLRLLAAIQVAAWHAYAHLHITAPVISFIIRGSRYLPGIPVFFTISGFLVFASFERNPNLSSYARNRFLRIFPALWMCLLITIGVLITLGYISSHNFLSGRLWGWIVAQATFFQFYTPDIFRSFGVGNPNGALWTIPVEIGFYAFVPFLFWITRKTKINISTWIVISIAISVLYNLVYQPYKFSTTHTELVKLIGVTPGPYLFYFLLGSFTAANWRKIHSWYQGKGWHWLAAYFVYCLVFGVWLHKFQPGYWTGGFHFISTVLLSQAIIALAYTHRQLSNRLLHHNDLSYGIYLYHMPVINVLLAAGTGKFSHSPWLATGIVGIMAWISWRIVERPTLAKKKSGGG